MRALGDAGVSVLDCVHDTPPDAGEGFPYIAIPNIRDGKISLSGVRRISDEDFSRWTRKTLPKAGDVVVTRRGRVGDTAAIPRGLECAIGQNLVLLRSDGLETDQSFLKWATRGPAWDKEVDRLRNVGAVFDSLNVRDISRLRIWVPSLDEQRRISEVLDALDDLIDMNERLAADLEQLARLISFRAADSLVPLAEIAEMLPARTVSPFGTVAHYSLPAFDNKIQADIVDGAEIKSGKISLTEDVVIVSRLNPHIPRIWAVYTDKTMPSVASTEFVPIRGVQACMEEVFALTSSLDYVNQLLSHVTGTTGSHQRVNKTILLDFLVPDVRNLNTQTRATIREAVREAHGSRSMSRILRRSRDELLAMLMSGEVKVNPS